MKEKIYMVKETEGNLTPSLKIDWSFIDISITYTEYIWRCCKQRVYEEMIDERTRNHKKDPYISEKEMTEMASIVFSNHTNWLAEENKRLKKLIKGKR